MKNLSRILKLSRTDDFGARKWRERNKVIIMLMMIVMIIIYVSFFLPEMKN